MRFVPEPARPANRPGAAGGCPGSLRLSGARSGEEYAAWWVVRPDSSAVLYSASSGDGGRTWSGAAEVDALDRSVVGCDRPPPALASVGDTVHVVYAETAPEGTGIFFAHSMDRARMFHTPVTIVYGSRLVPAAVAADAGRVVVAYEDPSAALPQIGLAISNTMGHIFERRTQASTGVGATTSPQVALAGNALAVAWIQRARRDGIRAARMVRTGRLQ